MAVDKPIVSPGKEIESRPRPPSKGLKKKSEEGTKQKAKIEDVTSSQSVSQVMKRRCSSGHQTETCSYSYLVPR